jgi:hypothetical protein
MTPKQICSLFGGIAPTSRLLGHSSPRYLRTIIAGKNPWPEDYTKQLQKEAERRGKELIEFSKM